jgi:hypothetical protein
MNKLILTIIGLIILLSISGQEVQKLNYQINFGTNISIPYKKTIETHQEFEGHPIMNFKSGYDYFVEFILTYNLNPRMSLNSGVSFINNKLQVNSTAGQIEQDGIIRTNYLGIPLEFNYQIFENIPLRIGFGAYLNLLIKSKEKGTMYIDTTGFSNYYPDPYLESMEIIQEYDNDITGNYNNLDFGLTSKVEYEFKAIKNTSMVVFSKFNYGLTNTRKGSSSIEWKNYNLLFGLGIKI